MSILILWLQSPSTVILEPKKIKGHCFHCFSICLPWSDGTGCHDLSFFWMLSFKPAFSLSSFTLIKRLFSYSSLSAVRVVSSTYLRLLIFLLAILILACDFSNSAFFKMYSAYKLNKQGDNIQLCVFFSPYTNWRFQGLPYKYIKHHNLLKGRGYYIH